MASLSDLLTALQNGVIALNNLVVQTKGSLTNISGQLAKLVCIRGAIAGLTLSTAGGSTTFGIAAGVATDSTSTVVMSLSTAISKTTAAWAVGAGNGSFDGTGAAPTATAGSYHVHLIERTDTGVVDAVTSLSATAPTLPAGYTISRRIGSVRTNGAFQWVGFVQEGDDVLWTTPFVDINTAAQTNVAILYPLSVPTGVKVTAKVRGYFLTAAGTLLLFTGPDETSAAPNATIGNINAINPVAGISQSIGDMAIRTDTSGQIRVNASGAVTSLVVDTFGYTDTRGRFA